MQSEDAYGFKLVNVAVTASQSNVAIVAAPGIGKRLVVDNVLLSSITSTGTSELTIKSGANIIIGPLKFGNAAQVSELTQRHFCNPNEALVLNWNQSSTGELNLNVHYHVRG